MLSSFFAPYGWPFYTLTTIFAIICIALLLWESVRDSLIMGGVYAVIMMLFGMPAVPAPEVAEAAKSLTAQPAAENAFWAFLVAYGVWIVVAAELTAYTIALRSKSGWWAMASIPISIVLLQIAGIPLVALAAKYRFGAIAVVLGWVAIGMLWMPQYWRRHIKKLSNELHELKRNFLGSKNATFESDGTMPRQYVVEFENWIDRNSRTDFDDTNHFAHKSELMAVAFGWPLSMFEVFVWDYVVNLYSTMFNWVSGWLSSITSTHYAIHNKDKATDEERAAYRQR